MPVSVTVGAIFSRRPNLEKRHLIFPALTNIDQPLGEGECIKWVSGTEKMYKYQTNGYLSLLKIPKLTYVPYSV